MTVYTSAHVSAAEAARLYGLSEKTVRRWIRAGRLRADKRDGMYSVALADVSALAGQVSAHASVQESAPLSAPGTDTSEDDVRPSEEPGTDLMRAEAMAAYTRSVLEPLVAALERSQSRVSELERENGGLIKDNGTLAERLAAQKRLRDAAIARAAELEQRLEVAATRAPAPDPFPTPIPPTPNVIAQAALMRRVLLAVVVVTTLAIAGVLAPVWR